MFEQTFVPRNGGRRPWTMALSVAFQCLLLGLLVLLPLIYTEAGPRLMRWATLEPPPGQDPTASEPQPRVAPSRPRPQQAPRDYTGLIEPAVVPRGIPPAEENSVAEPGPPGPDLIEGSIPGGRGVPFGTGSASSTILQQIIRPPAPPRPQASQEKPATIRVSVGAQAARIISQTQPVYPPLARQARISGVVQLAAIISESGTIEELRVVSGHFMLVEAAVDAVRTWRYRPTFLNGIPVRVDTTIEVRFVLSQ